MSYLSTTEKAKIIRNELKAIGITSKHISVVKDSWAMFNQNVARIKGYPLPDINPKRQKK